VNHAESNSITANSATSLGKLALYVKMVLFCNHLNLRGSYLAVNAEIS
jgi:hypothetical protein